MHRFKRASALTARLLGLIGLSAVTVTVSGTLLQGAATAVPAPDLVVPAANPNPARITDASWWLMEELLDLQPGTANGGIYTNKPGYHNTRTGAAALNPNDYSVRDAEDQGGPSDKAAGYDWTFYEAQGASPNYSNIARYSNRLLASGTNPNDPRLNGWREFIGQTDNDSQVESWDFRYDRSGSNNDTTHLWHIHLSEDRDKVTSMENKEALLSVLRGETVEEWLGKENVEGGSPQVEADVNNDGFDDLVTLYDYGDNSSRLWVALSNGTSFGAQQPWWNSSAGGWSTFHSKLAVGDFTDDGIDDVGILYGYDDAVTKFWVFESTGTSFTAPQPWWTSGAGGWSWANSKLAVGDYNKDGAADLGIFYKYEGSNSRFWVATSTGTTLNTPTAWWNSTPGGFSWDNSKLAVGDYNKDGTADLGIFYKYEGSNSRFWVATSTGTTLNTPTAWWNSTPGGWSWDHSKLA